MPSDTVISISTPKGPSKPRTAAHRRRSSILRGDSMSKIFDENKPPTGCWDKSRNATGRFMTHLYTEIFVMVVVVLYSILVLFDLSIDEATRDNVARELRIIDLSLLSLFMVELALRLYAFGMAFLKNCWNVFDAVVIIVSLIMGIIEAFLSSLLLLRILRLRGVLRLLRLMVLVGKVKQSHDAITAHRMRIKERDAKETPLERVMFTLHELSKVDLSKKHKEGIEYIFYVITNNQLYAHAKEDTAANDEETNNWLQAQYQPAALHDDDILASTNVLPAVGRTASGRSTFATQSDKESKRFMQRVRHVASHSRGMTLERSMKMAHPGSSSRSLGSDAANEAGAGAGAGVGVGVGAGLGFGNASAAANANPLAIAPVSSNWDVEHGQGSAELPYTEAVSSRAAVLSKMKMLALRSLRLSRLLEQIVNWEFDILAVSELTEGNPLFFVAFNLLEIHGCIDMLHSNEETVHSLLYAIEAGYRNNPYHNSLHAADVTQTVSWFLSRPFLMPYVTQLEQTAAILAAAIHDFKHPGVNNAFEIAIRSEVATTYNDAAVLENMHVAEFFRLLKHKSMNIFANLEQSKYIAMRKHIIHMVLGTDMAKHFEELAHFKSKLIQVARSSDTAEANNATHITNAADSQLFLRMVMHTADVSNPAKPLVYAKTWAQYICKEFYLQGDKERARGLPISTFMDRNKPNMPKLQSNFITFIVAPLFEEWAGVMQSVRESCLQYLNINKIYWAKQQEIHDENSVATTPAKQRPIVRVMPKSPATALGPSASPARAGFSPPGVANASNRR